MSEKDQQLTKSFGIDPDRTVCLPNGVDLERFQPICTPPEPTRLLFIGTFAHLPNLLAIEFFLREVWPQVQIHGATLHIIAGDRSQYYVDRYQDRVRVNLAQTGIEVEDFVADVRPAYRRAAIVIAPLLASAGTNIKIMEAMAMGKPIVSTPAGVNGLDLNPDKDVKITSTATGMARSILELFEDTAARDSLGRQARATVESRFGWDAIAGRQKQLYHELLNGHEP
jgi:glycosyltransferase involved in cell wall biosynthesis